MKTWSDETAVTARGSCITLVFDFPGVLSVEEKACEAHAQRLTKDRFNRIEIEGESVVNLFAVRRG
jgi:hypothetical protein